MTHCHTYIESLRKQGYRITPQREIIIQTLAHGDNHMTADDIYNQIQQRTKAINLATVYRTVDLLVNHGLATRFILGDGRVAYATTQHGEHIHLVCRHCGTIVKVDHQLIESLVAKIQTQQGFSADLSHITIFGLCEYCKSTQFSNQ